MNIIFVLAVTMCIEKSGSQILTISPGCFSNGNTLKINCETPAVNDTISFTLNGGNEGSCRPGLGCGSNIAQADTTTSLAIQYNGTEHDGSWRCTFGPSLSPVVIIAENPCNSLCDGDSEANTTLTCCSLIPAIVKLLIILWLWCNKPKPVPPPIEPEPVPPPIGSREVIFIEVTAQRQLTSALQNINGQHKDIPLSDTRGGYLYSIGVRAGELLDCAFQTGENVLALSFKINDDVLYVKHGQHITLPTTLKVIPPYSRITWDLNGKPFEVREPLFKTQVTKHTYGVYGIRMTFERLEIVICIQNMIVQEPKPVPPLIGKYWILMVVFVVIDIVCGVIGGIVTGYYRSTDGYCVDVTFIILMVLAPMIFFNVLEVALIYFMLIKRTDSKESSGDPDPSITMMSTSTKRTVSHNAGTTRSLTDGLSSSEVTATTYEGQNNRNWQPPNANTAVNPDAHQ